MRLQLRAQAWAILSECPKFCFSAPDPRVSHLQHVPLAVNQLCAQAWGHSTVVGPFAEILGSCDEKPTIVYADMDFTQVR